MKSLIGANASAADFDHPLEMLSACHERIGDRLETLERLVAHLPQHGCDEQARQAATNVMRYFDTAGEHHHDDEERDLFPALERTRTHDAAAAALIARLREEHVRLRGMWQTLRAELQCIAAGSGASLDAAHVERFGALYRQHIDLEELELLPLAEKALGESDTAALGAAMARRRGVTPP
jgi:hemerythrin-like domain-containing protein